jgi:hypothetical protein
MQAKTSPCVRLVLVRNAQCVKHQEQGKGNFQNSEYNSPSPLTEEGKSMRDCLSSIIKYYSKRGFCDSDPPQQSFNIIVDGSAPQHLATAEKLIQDNQEILPYYVGDIKYYILSDDSYYKLFKEPDKINTYFVFTCAKVIHEVLADYGIPNYINFGVALASATTIDIFPDYTCFIHDVGSLAPLSSGGYDVSKLKWWNNS